MILELARKKLPLRPKEKQILASLGISKKESVP
jgi:hypothetical protein